MKKLISVLILFIPIFLFGVTREVSLDGTQQYTSIQTAVNACSNGDSVLVYPGRYIEIINLNGHSITLASLYSLNPQQAYMDSTIIDGNLDTCIEAVAGETLTVNGFTLVNNEEHLNITPSNNGGAFSIWYNCHVYIKNCIIRDCLATWGGGISAGLGSIIEFSNVSIHSNRARERGGGILLSGGGQLVWDESHPSSVYDNTAAVGMDLMIDSCDNIIDVHLSLGSRAMSAPDNYFVSSYDNSQQPTIAIAQSYFPVLDTDVYVSPTGNDNNNGLSVTTPFKTIKHALQVINSNPDDSRTVHLAAGTYSFAVNGQLIPLSFKPHVRILGAGTGQTIIDGELHNTFFAGWNVQGVSLSDMSFINGRAVGTNPIEIWDSSDIELRKLILSNNQGAYASGIRLLRCNNIICENLDIGNTAVAAKIPTVYATECNNLYVNGVISHNNQITNNQDYFVGLLFNESDVVLRNTIIANNIAPDAYVLSYQNVYAENSENNLDMCNVLIYNNSISQCIQAFAPIYLQNRFQSMTINNCTFAGNQGVGYFTKIFAYADVSNIISYNPGFSNELFLKNHVWSDTEFIWYNAEVNIKNSLFRSSTVPSDLPNLVTSIDNIMNGNPLFLGSTTDTLAVTQPEYYYLSANSPCINTGVADTTGMNLPSVDLAGNQRVWNGRIDMGCYEYGAPPVANEDPEYPPILNQINITIYPNPIYISGSKGGNTYIEFTLHSKTKELPLIEIFNVKGQKVKTIEVTESFNNLIRKAGLSNQVKQNGVFYSTIWDCKNDKKQSLGSGAYIVRVSADGLIASKKIMLIK